MTNTKPVRKAVFPVAGLGTRFLPATKVLSKEMIPLNDRPVLQHSCEEAREAGIEEFIFVTSPDKEMLLAHFSHNKELEQILKDRGEDDMLQQVRNAEIPDGKLLKACQERPLGLGHAVWCARELVGDEPFAVLLPDDVFIAEKGCLSQMMETYENHGGNMVAVMNVSKEETARYGVVDIESDDGKIVKIKGLVEKPKPEDAPSASAIIGRYILQPEIFKHLGTLEEGAGGEIQLTDAMANLLGQQPFYGLRFAGTRYDCGTRLGFMEAHIAFSLNDPVIGKDVRNILERFSGKEEKERDISHVCAG